MDVLNRILSTASHSGLTPGFSMGRSEFMHLEISHLLFADDAIIFYDNDCEQIINLQCILDGLGAIFGLRVNLSRSSILAMGEVQNASAIASILGVAN